MIRPRVPLPIGMAALAAACHVTTLPIPQRALDCALRAAADRGYQPAYATDQPNTLLLSRRSGDQADDLFVRAKWDSAGGWYVDVGPSTMHFADRNDPVDRILPTSVSATDAATYVRKACDHRLHADSSP
jgi:hypothetical protein